MINRRSIKILLGDAGSLADELKAAFPQHDGIVLVKAESKGALLQMVESESPDLVMLDSSFPGVEPSHDGCNFKTHPALQSIPVVLILPHDQSTFLAERPGANCDAVIVRPIDRQRLWRAVGQLLNTDNRVMPRAAVRLRVHFGVGSLTLLTNYSVNMSTGGVFIETSELFEAETPLTLEFSLPGNSHKIRCSGRVAWVNSAEQPLSPSLPPGIGVQFLDLNLDDVRTLRAFIAKSVVKGSW